MFVDLCACTSGAGLGKAAAVWEWTEGQRWAGPRAEAGARNRRAARVARTLRALALSFEACVAASEAARDVPTGVPSVATLGETTRYLLQYKHISL